MRINQFPEIKSVVRYLLGTVFIALIFTGCNTKKAAMTEPMEIRVTDTVFVSEPKEETESEEQINPYRSTYRRVADLLHTDLNLNFNYQNKEVIGVANLTFTPLVYPVNSLTLDAKSFEINSVTLSGSELDFEYDGKQVSFDLAKQFVKGDTFTVVIDYSAFPYREEAGGSAAILSDRGLYFIDPDETNPHKPTQIWTQGETESSSKWFPTIDKPNERCTQVVRLNVKDEYETLSNGLLTSSQRHENGMRTDIWTMNKPHAPYLFMLAIGDFHRENDEWDGLPLEYIVEHDYASDASMIFDHTPEMLTYFSELLDYRYPWDKYSQVIVRDYVSGAMENTTASLFGQFLQRPAGDLMDNGNDRIVAHELFHQWFGDLVTCESWSNLTLNEGFANYSEYLWLAHEYGEDEGQHHRYTELQGYLNQANQYAHPLVDFHYDKREDMFDAHSYNKGGLVLHMLRHHVGDRAFFASLNHYLNTKEYEAVEVHDLRLAFEEITGMDLNWFFNQWFLEPGHPVIQMTDSYSAETGTLTIKINQTQTDKGWPLFRLLTEVEVYTKTGSLITMPLEIKDEEHTFTVNVDSEPDLILLDPEYIQLMERQFHTPASLMLYDKSSNIRDRLSALQAIVSEDDEESNMLVSRGLLDNSHYVRQQTLLSASGFEQVIKELPQIATKDPHANVRSAAVSILPNVSDQLLLQLLSDESNRVVAAAAYKLLETDSTRALEWATNHQGSNSQSLLQVVADIYVDQEVKNKSDFFNESADRMSFETLFPFYTTWAGYLVYEDASVVSAQLEDWSDQIDSDDTDIYTKYAILTALQPLSQYLPMDTYEEEEKSEIQGYLQQIGMSAMKLMNQSQ